MKEEIKHRRPIEREGFAMLYHVLTLDKSLSDGAFRLYALLLKYAQQKDHAYPGLERLAEELDKTRVTISRLMAELVSKKLVSRQRRRGTSSITWLEDLNEVYGECIENDTTESVRIKNDTSFVSKMIRKEEEVKKKKKIPRATDYLSHCAEIEKNQQEEKQWSTPASGDGIVSEAIDYLYALMGSDPPRAGGATWHRIYNTIEPVLKERNVRDIAKVRIALVNFRDESPVTFRPFYKSFADQLDEYLGRTDGDGRKVIRENTDRKVIRVGR